MAYLIEYRDEAEMAETMHKLKKAKEAICEVWEMLDKSGSYNERRYPMMRNYPSYPSGIHTTRNYREDENWEEDYRDGHHRMGGGRYGY